MIDLRAGGFKGSVRFGLLIAAIAAAGLSACGRGDDAWTAPPSGAAVVDTPAEAGYLAPPRVTGAAREGEAMRIAGTAAPGARVRIGPPRGQAQFVDADAEGRWSVQIRLSIGTPAADERRRATERIGVGV